MYIAYIHTYGARAVSVLSLPLARASAATNNGRCRIVRKIAARCCISCEGGASRVERSDPTQPYMLNDRDIKCPFKLKYMKGLILISISAFINKHIQNMCIHCIIYISI